ncbi:MAG: recombination protein RecR, partial [Acidobacteriota bacterium]
MPDFAEPLERLIAEFRRLPGIGQKSAQRLAFHVMRAPRESAQRLSQALLDVKDQLTLCGVCNNIASGE